MYTSTCPKRAGPAQHCRAAVDDIGFQRHNYTATTCNDIVYRVRSKQYYYIHAVYTLHMCTRSAFRNNVENRVFFRRIVLLGTVI